MKESHRTLCGIGIIASICVILVGTPVGAQMDHSKMDHGKMKGHEDKMAAMHPSHGGQMEVTENLGFETVFTESEIRVYVTDSDGKPHSSKGIEGKVMLKPKEGKSTDLKLSWTLGADDPTRMNRMMPGMMMDKSTGYLMAAFDSRSTEQGDIKAHIMLSNLPDKEKTTAHWEVSYNRGPLFGMACPMHPEQASLESGECTKCGGMKYEPATVFYECCDGCGEMRRTAPGTCEKCGMELQLEAVELPKTNLTPAKPRHSGHSH